MCTCLIIKSKDGDYFLGRTLDFIYDLTDKSTPFAAEVRSEPAGTVYQGSLGNWTGKYKVAGVGLHNAVAYYDAMNDQGLVGELNALVEAGYGQVDDIKAAGQTPLDGTEVITRFVSQFASVAEIRQHYQEYAIADVDYAPLADDPYFKRIPCHYTFTDPTGDAVVLEPVKGGKFRLFDSIGVTTNSPTYDWHLTNLRNYVNVQGHNVGDLTLQPVTGTKPFKAEQVGFGSGLLGIPGDYTSTARFLRGAFLIRYIDDFTADQGFDVLFNVFNSVFVPKGVEKMSADVPLSDHTEYWAGYDAKNKTFVVRSQKGNSFLKRSLDDFADDHEETVDLPTKMVFA